MWLQYCASINDVTDQFAERVSCNPILYIMLFVNKEILPKICNCLIIGTIKNDLFLQIHIFKLLTSVVRLSGEGVGLLDAWRIG